MTTTSALSNAGQSIAHSIADHDETLALLTELLACRLMDGDAISEYELIRWLQDPQQSVFQANAMQDNVGLFRTHFLLMHCLYLLQQRWADEQQGYLSISALKIQRLAWQDNQENTLDRHDPLAAYYLDLTHLDNTGSEDVQALLDDFWQRMLLPINKNEDLAALGLENDAAPDEIRSQYRRLAMQNHPDRGGDAVIFGKITSAYQRLRQTW